MKLQLALDEMNLVDALRFADKVQNMLTLLKWEHLLLWTKE